MACFGVIEHLGRAKPVDWRELVFGGRGGKWKRSKTVGDGRMNQLKPQRALHTGAVSSAFRIVMRILSFALLRMSMKRGLQSDAALTAFPECSGSDLAHKCWQGSPYHVDREHACNTVHIRCDEAEQMLP